MHKYLTMTATIKLKNNVSVNEIWYRTEIQEVFICHWMSSYDVSLIHLQNS